MRSHLLTAAAVVGMCLLLPSPILWANGLSVFQLEVSLPHPESKTGAIHVKLTNKGPDPSILDKSDLPWRGAPTTLRVQIFRLDDPKIELEHLIPIVDYYQGKYLVAVAPGEAIEGDVNLLDEFPDLVDEIQQHGVIIKWKCRVALLPIVCLEKEGGSLKIPRERKS